METTDQQLRQLLWEATVIFSDPHHPINDRRHPEHDRAVAVFRQIQEEGRQLLSERVQQIA